MTWSAIPSGSRWSTSRYVQGNHTVCPANALSSPPTAASSGTRKSTTRSNTTRTVPSSTPLSSRTAWPVCLLPMRRKQSSSRRRWTSARRMHTRIQETSPLAAAVALRRAMLHPVPAVVARPSIASDSAVCCLDIAIPVPPLPPLSPLFLHAR